MMGEGVDVDVVEDGCMVKDASQDLLVNMLT